MICTIVHFLYKRRLFFFINSDLCLLEMWCTPYISIILKSCSTSAYSPSSKSNTNYVMLVCVSVKTDCHILMKLSMHIILNLHTLWILYYQKYQYDRCSNCVYSNKIDVTIYLAKYNPSSLGYKKSELYGKGIFINST
jgi:hypothetical protein